MSKIPDRRLKLCLMLASVSLWLSAFVLTSNLWAQVETDCETVALWLFDEPRGLYPSSVLDSNSDKDYPLVIGQGARLVNGKYGNALSPVARPPLSYPEGPREFGLPPSSAHPKDTRLTWSSNRFAAMMTTRETHLRSEVGFVNAVETQLNLGDFDWTLEFWLLPGEATNQQGIVYELATYEEQTLQRSSSLRLAPGHVAFELRLADSTPLVIPTNLRVLSAPASGWHHLAFVYDASARQLRHFVDGRLQPIPEQCSLANLPVSPSSSFAIGRTADGEHPLGGSLDEFRVSVGQVYRSSFQPPQSFAPSHPQQPLVQGLPPLFDENSPADSPLDLGSRKHLFIDDALLQELGEAVLVVNPPRKAELVIDEIEGTYRKHLTVVEDAEGLIRLYNGVAHDHLAVSVSRDGIHFSRPQLEGLPDQPNTSKQRYAVVLPEMVGGLGNPFIDPNGPESQRWKYFSDYHRRGIYLYTSADGYHWQRHKTAILPFRSGTQSCTFYDEQHQRYVSYHRSGIHHFSSGDTERSSVRTEHETLLEPLEFQPLTAEQYRQRQTAERLRDPLPWYLDNGPLTPGGFGLEFPHTFRPAAQDPVGMDIYVTKAQKYPWAPDTYLAFPIAYFHYGPDGPPTRQTLSEGRRGRGSGSVETQLAVSRDGQHWQRLPQPAYVGIGQHAGRKVVNAYLAHGMVRRGEEIWQYYFGETQYHSAHRLDAAGRGVYRLVQRLDGFVSLDSPYDQETVVVTKPLRFDGNRLILNIDTDATGYAQVGLLDQDGNFLPGYALDDCSYINGDFIQTEVQWSESGGDLSPVAGEPVQVAFRMRGSKLYAMQFVTN